MYSRSDTNHRISLLLFRGVYLLVLALLSMLLFSAVATGQDRGSVEWVQAAKDELRSLGVPTENVGPCGAFQIINLAAWRHQDTGIGVLSKPGGNHCEFPAGSGQFYSVDFLIFPNGDGGDMLIKSETDNIPNWSVEPHPELASRWHAPVLPFLTAPVDVPVLPVDVPPAPPVLPVEPVLPSIDLSPYLHAMQALELQLLEVKAMLNAHIVTEEGHWRVVAAKWKQVAAVLTPIVTVVTLWLTQGAK